MQRLRRNLKIKLNHAYIPQILAFKQHLTDKLGHRS
jgi:hypothetical protein